MNGICAVIPGNTKEEIVNNLKELLKDIEHNTIYIGGCVCINFDYSTFDKEITTIVDFVEYYNAEIAMLNT